jgi:replication initiation protein RepC
VATPHKEKVLKLTPDELVRLAPRLKAYLRQPDPDWRDLVDAAGFLRSDLDVSKSLWGEACVTMGRKEAAIAIAIVSTKDPEHFRTTAGGYFHGMVRKAKAGELNLDRTIWGMRRAHEPRSKSGTQSSSGGGVRPATSSSRPWN